MAENDASTPSRSQTRKAQRQMESADRATEREFYRYYHHSQRSSSDSRQPSLLDHLAQAPPSPPAAVDGFKRTDDKALIAFAQLGALRLNTRRCLISFFDRRFCYIVAEATRTLSLHTDQAEFEEDKPCWGASTFPKEKSICYYTVKLPFEHCEQSMDDYSNVPSLVIDDLSLDDRFKHYPFVCGPPYSRFYAGVPIRTPGGHSIGTYCVLDDKPRDGISQFELTFIKDMAATVMRHMEMSRATDDHKRGGVMVKSLGSFADGRASLEEWWDPWDSDAATAPENAPTHRHRRSTVSQAVSPAAISQVDVIMDRIDSGNSSVPSVRSPPVTSPSSGLAGSASITPASEVQESRNVEVATKSASATKHEGKDTSAPEVHAIFKRAAQMIVDATEAEGAVFFDAKVSSFGGLIDDEYLAEQPPDQNKPCAILGTAHYKKHAGLSSLSDDYTMSESVLKQLLRNYSHGQIFNMDAESSTSNQPASMGDDEADTSASRRSDSSKSSDDENLLKDVFPQARSLVLYPLWDSRRDRWFASVVLWSSDPYRVFTSEQELSYLAAFSNSVMAEVARLDTKLADAAKADFISSISHELRSPLHGILGMTDLLKDTQIDGQQFSHVQTIETCGKTLLETINHILTSMWVLDYAKINNLTRGASKRHKKRPNRSKHIIRPGQGHTNDIMTIISDVDMSVTTEEALESVFAGFHFQQSAAQDLERRPSKLEPPPISVIVDINKSDNYVFRTQPGAWRRVVMNLFGNALKYTPAGYIKVKVQVIPSSNSNDDCSEFRLTISDSGIGMSEDYVNNRLFHSFAQENPLSQGTGLGLSIVKQLVELLGGEIEVRSEKGRGTKFTVSCPLKISMLSPTVCATSTEREMERVTQRTKGMNVHFIGFDDENDSYFPVKSLKNKNATMLAKKALDNMCVDWFGMKVWDYGTEDAPAPDLFMATEAGARYLRTQYSQNAGNVSVAPVIVICRGAASAQSATAITVPGLIFECIAQPCGPHKLAKALTSCLDRHVNRLIAQSAATDTAKEGVSRLDLKENTPLVSPETVATLLEPTRPPITSAMSAPEVRSLDSSPARKPAAPSRALHCLAVDDNPINLRLLRTFIEKLGHRHTLAKTGLEALEVYRAVSTPQSTPPITPPTEDDAHKRLKSRIDVILMDINMPEMDGLEATRQIRAFERDNGLPPTTIIALTGVASTDAQQEAHASGVNLFLIKPVRLADLEVVLKGVVTGEEGEKEKGKQKSEECCLPTAKDAGDAEAGAQAESSAQTEAQVQGKADS